MPLSKREKQQERLTYVSNKLHNAKGSIRNEWGNYLACSDSSVQCEGKTSVNQGLWRFICTSELPVNDSIVVHLEHHKNNICVGQDEENNIIVGNVDTEKRCDDERFQWILELNQSQNQKQEENVTWIELFIKNKKTGKYLNSTETNLVQLSDTAKSWEIGVTRFVL